MRFGRLAVIKQAEDYVRPDGRREAQWLCKCDCGNDVIVISTSLKRGLTKSCGCFMRERVYETHKKENKYDLSGKYGIGYTYKGDEFYFDLDDYTLIKEYCWCIDHEGYVSTNLWDDDKKKSIRMHRLIINVSGKKDEIDHINNNKKDNRKCNLRIVTRSQNGMNRGVQSNNKTGDAGVTFYEPYDKWNSQIALNGKHINLGYFSDFEDAVKARKEAEERYFGEYSYDNSQKIS